MRFAQMTNKELQAVVKRLREIDIEITRLFDEQREIKSNLTTEERNKVFDMVMSDGKSHWI
jgi:uncharacterized tellurite resistance protein B-like protein